MPLKYDLPMKYSVISIQRTVIGLLAKFHISASLIDIADINPLKPVDVSIHDIIIKSQILMPIHYQH